ncbi:signal transduction histidine kinase/CheY-like chemotaxis protein/CHASE3 domain sensor protein [Silvimonas terrae]|uniref:Virulence sensor protein BvgS n=1 Tax=Silvimonas terrae TaxID=300266 RepID=A0A840R9T7_9NEIS|nr:response regulator [Silvimonas terrae]MBB5189364.1 signal transduction histidine kinase/CheY-like chemotaxis protein/CHASE3 domain sensor protein [Silvimonas terrae]
MTDLSLPENTFRRILARNVLAPLIVAAVTSAIYIGLVLYLQNVSRWVDHADQVISKTTAVTKLLVDGETGLRGYVITGKASFLEPYNSSSEQFLDTLHEARALAADNPSQQAFFSRAEERYKEWHNYAEHVIKARQDGIQNASDYITSESGKTQMDQLRGFFSQIIQTEEAARAQRSIEVENTVNWLLGLTLAIGLFSGVVLVLSGRRQLQQLSQAYGETLAQQREHNLHLERQSWLRKGQTELATVMLGEQNIQTLAANMLDFMVRHLGAAVGAVYVSADRQHFARVSQYALEATALESQREFQLREGITGQAAAENRIIVLNDIPDDYLRVTSALGNGKPRAVLVIPARGDRFVNLVMELSFTHTMPDQAEEFVNLVAHAMGTAIDSAQYREQLQNVLSETQQLNEELQAQQEELKVANEELEEQSRSLRESQVRLESQQVELEQNNDQLEEQTQTLQQQRDELDARNEALSMVHVQLEERADELLRASRYKSEFLANMSHELRTPLNSALILSKLLADNGEGNLSPEQVQFASSIYSSGNDLLTLINDILDLSKVEAGKLDIWPEDIPTSRLLEGLEQMFKPLAQSKGVELEVVARADLPRTIVSDQARLQQILKNLLSNAIKFTEKGTVHIVAGLHAPGEVAFAVSDTGIGIAENELQTIFDAFHQADGATNRKFGGTGLGLTISRDLAGLLGGTISVQSTPGTGSTFTLIVPLTLPQTPADDAPASVSVVPASRPALPAPVEPATPALPDDRDQLRPNARKVLIIEDDATFARILYTQGKELGFDCLLASSAQSGFDLALELMPDAVMLDMKLPDQSGMTVLERLKEEPRTRHIPVHVISGIDSSHAALQAGAIGYALKPADREALRKVFARIEAKLSQAIKHVLVVEDDPLQRESMMKLIADEDVKITAVALAEDALQHLKDTSFDCMVVDLTLPDMAGYDLLKRMAADSAYAFPPVIVYTGRVLSREEEAELRRYSHSIIIKGARSPERLLDEVTLFLHRVETTLAPERQQMLKVARSREKAFEGRKIMVVDDDVRNIFALTSALEPKGAQIVIARNGRDALEKLDTDPDIDLVLMDIMMPEMDGYTAMRQIRTDERFARLPIIAVTANAMRDDQEKCLAAGANDYLAKPIDLDKLLSLIRVWMPKLSRL